jgi:hypothetical protein
MDSVGHQSRTLQQQLAQRYEAGSDYGVQRRPLHHRPLFWCGVVLFVVAISVFIFSDSLAWLPRRP